MEQRQNLVVYLCDLCKEESINVKCPASYLAYPFDTWLILRNSVHIGPLCIEKHGLQEIKKREDVQREEARIKYENDESVPSSEKDELKPEVVTFSVVRKLDD